MVKQLEGLFTTPAPCGAAAAGLPSNYENLVFEKLNVKFALIVFSCVQIASKLCLHSDVVEELSHITGISQRSIRDFSHVMLEQITQNGSPILST
ncbi:unnamed protein product [Merluccius merluccius]